MGPLQHFVCSSMPHPCSWELHILNSKEMTWVHVGCVCVWQLQDSNRLLGESCDPSKTNQDLNLRLFSWNWRRGPFQGLWTRKELKFRKKVALFPATQRKTICQARTSQADTSKVERDREFWFCFSSLKGYVKISSECLKRIRENRSVRRIQM